GKDSGSASALSCAAGGVRDDVADQAMATDSAPLPTERRGPARAARTAASRYRGALCALLTAATLAATSAAPAAGLTLHGTVSRNVDGDTIHVRVGGREDTVRFLGIDTPETKRPGTPVLCFGPAASERTARILPPGTAVRLVTDPTQATRDRYGRLLAYVYKPVKPR
ncbi:MAG: thermonuclease family protein, partial [Actinobacteria bacterium]|nr:thermonuclease family protein [Actinomycetota bacterium]